METEKVCALDQKTKANVRGNYARNGTHFARCPLCGNFLITQCALEKMESLERTHGDLRFSDKMDSYRASSYNEAQLRGEFIDPIFKAMGWDVHWCVSIVALWH